MNTFADNYALYILIPFITAGIGWSTNWLGIKMMMYPSKWIGIGRYIGWQGIIPRIRVDLTKKMVANSIDLICTPEEMVNAIDEANAVESISQIIEPQLEAWVDEIMLDKVSGYWDIAPKPLKSSVYRETKKQLPVISHEILQELKDRSGYIVNVSSIASEEARHRPEILTGLMKRIADKEFRFVILSGLYIGLPLGCIQALVWYFYPNDWVLPLFGAAVGAFTNWLALQILVFPGKPVNVLGFKIHGLFIARQPEVSVNFAHAFTHNFLDLNTVFHAVWNGEHKDEVHSIVTRQIKKYLTEKLLVRPMYRALVLAGKGKAFDESTLSLFEDKIEAAIKRKEVSQKLLQPVEALVAERLAKLEPHQFQNLLLPVFEEKQWILIIIGGALGFAVGTVQLVYLFGGQLM